MHKEHGDTWIDACVLMMCFGVCGLSADALMKLMVWHYVFDALKITIAVILMLSSHCCYCGDFSAVS